MAKKRALLVAINDYPGTRNDLQSCVNDLVAIEQTIAGDLGFADIKRLTDSDATVANVEVALRELFKGAEIGDQLLFFYSGHGTQVVNGTTMEEALYLFDGSFLDNRLVDLAKGLPPGCLTVFLDSCFSGGMEKRLFESDEQRDVARSKYALPDTTEKMILDVAARALISAYRPFGCSLIKTAFTEVAFRNALLTVKESDESGQPQLNGLLIAASSEDETASANTPATMGLSAFSFCFRKSLSSAKTASISHLIADANKQLKTLGFRQTPLAKANPADLVNRSFLSATPGT